MMEGGSGEGGRGGGSGDGRWQRKGEGRVAAGEDGGEGEDDRRSSGGGAEARNSPFFFFFSLFWRRGETGEGEKVAGLNPISDRKDFLRFG